MRVKFFNQPYLLYYGCAGQIDEKKYKVRRIGLGYVKEYQYSPTNFILLNQR